jgi:hypothetical protein
VLVRADCTFVRAKCALVCADAAPAEASKIAATAAAVMLRVISTSTLQLHEGMAQIGGRKLLGSHFQYVKANAFQHRANREKPIQGQ